MGGMAKFVVRLEAAGTSNDRRRLSIRGVTVVAYSVGSPVEVFTQQNEIGGKQGVEYKLEMRRGEKLFAAEEFDTVSFRNLGVGAQTCHFYIGYGDFEMPPPNIQVADTHNCQPDVDVGASVPALQLIAANPLRKRVFIQNDIASAGSFRICGDTEFLGSRGLVLGPGDIFEDDVKGALFALRTAALASTAHVAETVYNAAPP